MQITNVYALGVRYIGLALIDSPDAVLTYVSVDLAKGTGANADLFSGSGIWTMRSNNTLIDHAQIFASGYYYAGYITASNQPRDLVAIHGSSGSQVVHSNLKYTNAAAVYVTCDNTASSNNDCPGEPSPGSFGTRSSNITIWDNDIQNTLQHGIDVAYTDNPSILTNRIQWTGHAGIALGWVGSGTLTYNSIQNTGTETLNRPTESYGAVLLLQGTNNMTITNNTIYGPTQAGETRYAVYFRPWSGSPAQTGNNVSSNTLFTGTSGWIGGATTGNTTAPNTLY